MTLSIPGYLRASNVQSASLRYEWDDWKSLPAADTPDPSLVGRLKDLSQRAVLAFACGSAEWIAYRFAKLEQDPKPWEYLVAAWAMIVDVRYGGYGTATTWQVVAHKGWEGPVRRPIHNALLFLEAALQEVAWNSTDPVRRAGRISALAAYVMTDPEPYKTWCQQVLERFTRLYPRSPEDPLGDVVPREAVDPDHEFLVEYTETLVNRFLASLDPRSNLFLSPPAGMLQHFEDGADFAGTPYHFELEIDRERRRLQWDRQE